MNSVSNIFIKQVSAQITSVNYDGTRERVWGKKILDFDLGSATITSVLVSTISFVLGIAITVSVIFIVVGALKYISSAGNKTKAEEAQTTLKNAFLALIGISTLGLLLDMLVSVIQ